VEFVEDRMELGQVFFAVVWVLLLSIALKVLHSHLRVHAAVPLLT
jgi:hypothetical protein